MFRLRRTGFGSRYKLTKTGGCPGADDWTCISVGDTILIWSVLEGGSLIGTQLNGPGFASGRTWPRVEGVRLVLDDKLIVAGHCRSIRACEALRRSVGKPADAHVAAVRIVGLGHGDHALRTLQLSLTKRHTN